VATEVENCPQVDHLRSGLIQRCSTSHSFAEPRHLEGTDNAKTKMNSGQDKSCELPVLRRV
jgi:hypothetical protein